MDGGKEKSKGITKNGKVFWTDGSRGKAGITLTAYHAYKVGRFLSWYYNVLCEHNGDAAPPVSSSARILVGVRTCSSTAWSLVLPLLEQMPICSMLPPLRL